MKIILVIIIAGILGATGRILLLELVSRVRVTHVDPIKAVGTLYHGYFGHPFLRGIGANYLFGIISAFIYLVLVSFICPVASIPATAAFCALIGLFQGYAEGFPLVPLVAEHHPLPEFRKYGHEVVLCNWLVQILYGLIVGVIFGWTKVRLF
jgi:hypothetical protein